MPKQKINNNTTLSEIFEIKGSDKVLAKHKVPCLHCPMAQMEMGLLKIGDICKKYGIGSDKLLKELNKL